MVDRVSKEPAQRVVVRKKQRFFDLKLVYYTALAIAIVALVYRYPPGGATVVSPAPVSEGNNPSSTVPWLELGHELATRRLWNEALRAYDKALAAESIPPSEAANLCFRLGEICKDELSAYERAIGYYLRVRHYDPQSPSLKKVGLRVVACLEACGNKGQSQHELNALTKVGGGQRTSNPLSPIVAQTGSRDFTLADIDEGIAKLPEQVRAVYSGRQGRLRFLREHLLMPHLLAEAGRRNGLAQSQAVREKLAEVERSLIASTFIQQRVCALGAATPQELELFYRAEAKRYQQPSSRRFTAWSTSSAAAAFSMAEGLRDGQDSYGDGRRFGPVVSTITRLPGLEDGAELVRAAFATAIDQYSTPVRAGGEFWVVRVDEEREGRLPPFDEIRERVQRDHLAFRQQQEVQKLIDEQIKVQNVKLDPLAIPQQEDEQ